MNPQMFEIKRNALDDGPGIRSVIFFKGCALNCIWCHNPESKTCSPELGFDTAQCMGCNQCVNVCSARAISAGSPINLDRSRCTLCFACSDVCPSNALTRIGEVADYATILTRLRADYPFYRASGGGVTLSGGEPTLHPSLLSRLLPILKDEGVNILLQTSGFFSARVFYQCIYPNLDSIYFDLKLHNSEAHQRYCGQNNKRILENLSALIQRERNGGANVLPRLALIPGITDTEENLRAWAHTLKRLEKKQIKLLRYNPLWPQKLNRLGTMQAVPSALQNWPTPMVMQQATEIFDFFDIAVE